jgi:cell pole-organizing protein PopZ
MSDGHDMSNTSGPGSAAEPSMEEILASIRRILKEDEGTQAPAEDEDDDLLVLDSSMIATQPDPNSATQLPVDTGFLAAHDAAPVTSYHEPLHFSSEPTLATEALAQDEEAAPEAAEFHTPESPASEPVREPDAHEEEEFMEDHVQTPDGLVSEEATSAIANTIGTLVRNISTERAVSISKGGITIEDIVREEIKPVLKAWLDTHLPTLVERIVRAEIGRVIDRSQA